MKLNNVNCVITGASSGIGREVALLLAARGCTIVAIARDQSKLNELVVDAKALNGRILPVAFDLKNHNDFNQLAQNIKSQIGMIDLVINNAAIGHYSDFSTQKVEEIMKVANTTLVAPILFTKICLPLMRNDKSSIVFVSSLAGKMGFPKLSIYSAAKHGIEGFADSLTQEITNKIFIFRPGVTATNFFTESGMEDFEKRAKQIGLMKSANYVATELIFALENNRKEYTVGSDKYLLPLLPILPRQYRFSVLKFLNMLLKRIS